MYRLLFILFFPALLISCSGKTKSIAEKPLQLENFDFNTAFSALLPDKNKSTEYDGYYQIKAELIVVDTILAGDFIGSEKPIRIEYRHRSHSSTETLVKFDDYKFNAVNFATTLDNKIMLISGLASEVSQKEIQSFVELLNKKYGDAAKTEGEFMNPFDIYTWVLEDRIIRYSVVLDDESNTMKIVMDKESQTIENGEKNPHFKAYLFLINKIYADEIIGKVSSGDFVYCD